MIPSTDGRGAEPVVEDVTTKYVRPPGPRGRQMARSRLNRGWFDLLVLTWGWTGLGEDQIKWREAA
jgi:hypothetical protein